MEGKLRKWNECAFLFAWYIFIKTTSERKDTMLVIPSKHLPVQSQQ